MEKPLEQFSSCCEQTHPQQTCLAATPAYLHSLLDLDYPAGCPSREVKGLWAALQSLRPVRWIVGFISSVEAAKNTLGRAATIEGVRCYYHAASGGFVPWIHLLRLLFNGRKPRYFPGAFPVNTPRTGRDPLVFISYSRKNKRFARRLVRSLKGAGSRIWMDEGSIEAGDSFIERIQEGLAEASFFLILISEDSVESKWVQKELSVALVRELSGLGVTIIPVSLDATEMPVLLSDKKPVDFSRSYERGLEELLARIR